MGYDPDRHHDLLCNANPKAQVPTWEEDGLALFESALIMEYLEDRQPDGGLMPKDPAARATTRVLYNLADQLLPGPLKLIVHRPKDDPRRINATEEFLQALQTIEGRLDPQGPYAFGSDVHHGRSERSAPRPARDRGRPPMRRQSATAPMPGSAPRSPARACGALYPDVALTRR